MGNAPSPPETPALEIDRDAETTVRARARALVGLAGFTRSDVEDIEQELRLALLVALPRFDQKRASRSTFVRCVVDCRAIDLVRYRLAAKRDVRKTCVSLDEVAGHGDDRAPRVSCVTYDDLKRRVAQMARSQEERTSMSQDVSRAVSSLPARRRGLCQRLATQSRREIREHTGLSRRGLALQIGRVRERFRDLGLHHY